MSAQDPIKKLEERLGALKAQMAEVPQKTKEALESAKANVEAGVEAVASDLDQARKVLEAEVEAKARESKAAVESWLAERNVERLQARVDRKVEALDARIVVAAGAIQDVEEATLELAAARLDLASVEG